MIPERVQAAYQEYVDGGRVVEIMERYGLDLYRAIRRHGLSLRRRPVAARVVGDPECPGWDCAYCASCPVGKQLKCSTMRCHRCFMAAKCPCVHEELRPVGWDIELPNWRAWHGFAYRLP